MHSNWLWRNVIQQTKTLNVFKALAGNYAGYRESLNELDGRGACLHGLLAGAFRGKGASLAAVCRLFRRAMWERAFATEEQHVVSGQLQVY